MNTRYPGYDVLAKRDSPSWNRQTRKVIDERLALSAEAHRFCNDTQWRTLRAICDRIIPQPEPAAVPLAAMIDEKLHQDARDGYRNAHLPPLREAWATALDAINAVARSNHGADFSELNAQRQDELLTFVQKQHSEHSAWRGMPSDLFFRDRLLKDIVSAYYSHPVAWSDIGFGGPASPRGYVRMSYDQRDPWEAEEVGSQPEAVVRRRNARVR